MKFAFFIALAAAGPIFTGGEGQPSFRDDDHIVQMDYDFKQYMITLANEAVQ